MRWLVLLATACGVADFDVSQPVPEQRIEGSPLPAILGQFFDFPIEIQIQEQIEAMETGPIDSIHLKSLVLEITAAGQAEGDSDDFAFVDSIKIHVESSRAGSSLARVLVAESGAPGAVRRLEFDIVPDVNLLPYVNEGSIMTADGEGMAPEDDVTYNGSAVFRVSPL